MDIRLLRCTHCGIKYEHCVSGFDIRYNNSTNDLCGTCATTAKQLLSEAIPADQYIPKYVPTDEVTKEELEKASREEAKGLGSCMSVHNGGYLEWRYNNQKYFTKWNMMKCLQKDPKPDDLTVYKKMCLNTNTNTIEGEW